MNKTILSLAIASMTLIACTKEKKTITETTEAPDTVKVVKEETNIVIPDTAAVNKAWMEYATPGDAHKMMAAETGSWNEDMTMWMAANTEPVKNKMTAEYKMVMGGRYQESVHKGNFMGMPFEGKSTLSYDNASQQYTSTWIDNMGTGIMVMKGTYDPATKSFSFAGEGMDPVTKKAKKMREVYTIVDDNTRKMEMFDTGYDGKEFKNMEITMTRKK